MTEENAKFDAQWLSAYVDGELAGEELAQLEQHLAKDPQARQTVSELRALSQQLRSLPREVVGEDLRATILQRAERTMLLGDGPTPAVSPTAGLRRWGWAALALAASGVLILLSPSDPLEQKPLASAQPSADPSPRTPAPPEALVPPERQVAEESSRQDAEQAARASIERAEGAARSSAVPPLAAKVLEAAPLAAKKMATKTLTAPAPAAPLEREAAADAPAAAAVQQEARLGASRPPLQVFITLRAGADRFANFDQLLARHGIPIEDAAEAGRPAPAVASPSRAEGTAAYRSEGGANRALPAEEHVVWVEASQEQIARVLASCQQDAVNWASVRLEGGPSVAPFQQYQRSGLLAEEERVGLPVAAPPVAEQPREQLAAPETEPAGRAQRLSPGQRTAPSARQEAAVQVLFILQQPVR